MGLSCTCLMIKIIKFQSQVFWPSAINIFSVAVVLGILLKIYTKVTLGVFRSDKRLDGQVIIVTGASSGMGKVAALDFARRGARVILACIELELAEKAKDEIVKLTNNTNVVVRYLDLTSLASIRKFAEVIKSTESRLDVLVNNAGIAGPLNDKTKHGLIMHTNVYGPFLLTNLLIDLLKRSAPSRIVNVASLAHLLGRIDFDDLNCEKRFNGFFVYSDSKLCNIICSNEFARRLKGTGVTSNSLHPGIVKTDIWKALPRLVYYGLDIMMKLYFKTPEEGAQTTIFLAVSDDVAKVTGKYFVDCKESSPLIKPATDPEIAMKLWNACSDLVHLQPEEMSI